MDPVLVDPATGNDSVAIEMGDIVCSKQSRAQVTNQATHGVHGEDVEGIVGLNEEFELRGEVAAYASHDAVYDCCPWWDETMGGIMVSHDVSDYDWRRVLCLPRPRSDGDQASDYSGAETDRRPLLLKAVVTQAPSDARSASRKIGHDCRHNGTQIGA